MFHKALLLLLPILVVVSRNIEQDFLWKLLCHLLFKSKAKPTSREYSLQQREEVYEEFKDSLVKYYGIDEQFAVQVTTN